MRVAKNRIVGIHYRMTSNDNKTMDDNTAYAPLEYLHGYHTILKSLENALEGMEVGQTKEVTLVPEEAYGLYEPEKLMVINRSDLSVDQDQLQPGVVLESAEGNELVVTHVNETTLTLDGNHPLAGQTLHFTLQIVSIRDANPDELLRNQPLSGQNETCGPGCCC